MYLLIWGKYTPFYLFIFLQSFYIPQTGQQSNTRRTEKTFKKLPINPTSMPLDCRK